MTQDDTDVLTSDIQVDGNDASTIQKAIDDAKAGDTINLGTNKSYNVDSQISVYKQVTIKGDNVEINGLNVFQISSSDTTVQGLKFTNPNPAAQYRGSVSGNAISVSYQSNILIDNCSFINYHSGVYLSGVRDSNITNSYFTGVTTGVVPDSSDSGTKAINVMGSSNLHIKGNTFEGQILDGVSIASSSSNIYIENNTFINNTYAIYYGGASTEGNIIRNNRFITCGRINTTYYSTGLKKNVTVDYSNLPVISLQKASSFIQIINNTFIVKDNNLLILSEAENTAHGFASVIGGINITQNTVKKADPGVDGASVTFYYIKVLETLGISPVDAINIKDNNFSDIPDIQSFKIEFAQMHIDNGTVYIPQAKTATKMAVTYVKDGRVVVELAGIDDKVIENAKITYSINGGAKITDTTDQFGHIYINGLAGVCDIGAKYTGSSIYGDSSIETTIQMGSVQAATKITAGTLTVYAANAKGTKYKFTLKDGQGNALTNQNVSITFNGKVYSLKTDGNGAASFTIATNAAGKYDITMAFTGTSNYKGSVAASTITIQKQATKLTAAKKTFKKKATKKVTATLKDNNGKALSGKKVTLKVSGKTYKATTNKKGVATFKVKITKKGTFTATTSFSGDSLYLAKTVKSKIIVK